MDETGQPGDVTPGAGGDESNSRADRSWQGGGWVAGDAGGAAPAGSGPGAVGAPWRHSTAGFSAGGWADPVRQHGELRSPLSVGSANGRAHHTSNGFSHSDRQFTGLHQGLERQGDSDQSGGDHHRGGRPAADPSPARHGTRQSAEPTPGGDPVPAGQSTDAAEHVARVGPVVPAPRRALDDGGQGGDDPQPPWATAPAAEQPAGEPAPGDDNTRGITPAIWRQTPEPANGAGEAPPSVRRSEQPYIPRRARHDQQPDRSEQPVTGPATGATPPAGPIGATGATPPAGPGTSVEPAGQSGANPGQAGQPAPAESLPQRVPTQPGAAATPEPVEPSAETPELARIATHLRREGPSAQAHERPDGFDVNAILAAVRGVAGVRDASLRTTPGGAHRLRLDLADGADSAEVSRQVARLLQERMGLAAAPQNLPGGGKRTSGATGLAARQPGRDSVREAGRRRTGADTVPRRRRSAPADPAVSMAPASSGGAVAGQPGTTGSNGNQNDGGHGGPDPSGGQAPVRGIARPMLYERSGPRVVIDHIQVSVFGVDATVEVRLASGERLATGQATGPGVDGYLLRLCAVAAASAIDELLRTAGRLTDRGRCFVEHAAVVPFGNCEVAVVVVLLSCDGSVEQVSGSALVAGDPRQAVVRATLAAVNRRLAGLL